MKEPQEDWRILTFLVLPAVYGIKVQKNAPKCTLYKQLIVYCNVLLVEMIGRYNEHAH